ncbi:hypothetical protein B0J14DRAFT_574994 [Halenospora varia]|nr:hypothetical protein B0J14DRAFT_574994 [Halenospora varia]
MGNTNAPMARTQSPETILPTTDPSPAEDGAPPQAASEFACFPKLPLEIRLRIWRHACYHERTVGILPLEAFQLPFCNQLNHEDRPYIWKYKSYDPVPSPLHVSKESRREALKYYSLTFSTSFNIDGSTINTPPRVYVNFEADWLCFMGGYGSESAVFRDFTSYPIKRLAVNLAGRTHDLFKGKRLQWAGNGNARQVQDTLIEAIRFFNTPVYYDAPYYDRFGLVHTNFSELTEETKMNHRRDVGFCCMDWEGVKRCELNTQLRTIYKLFLNNEQLPQESLLPEEMAKSGRAVEFMKVVRKSQVAAEAEAARKAEEEEEMGVYNDSSDGEESEEEDDQS